MNKVANILQLMVCNSKNIFQIIIIYWSKNNLPITECLRKTARADVTVRVPGTGKITINGKDITYFDDVQPREQVSDLNKFKSYWKRKIKVNLKIKEYLFRSY